MTRTLLDVTEELSDMLLEATSESGASYELKQANARLIEATLWLRRHHERKQPTVKTAALPKRRTRSTPTNVVRLDIAREARKHTHTPGGAA